MSIVKVYPGVTEVGAMYDHRRTSSPNPTHLLFFAIEDTDKTPTEIVDIFTDCSKNSSVEGFRNVQYPISSGERFTVEVYFRNLVERSYVLKNAQENGNRVTLTGTRNQVCAELYLPVPKEPLYKVYCLHGLPLDSPESAYKIVKDAIIKWIKNNIKINGSTREKPRDYLVDILLGSDGHRLMHSADEESYYNGTMCIILKNTSVIHDDSESSRKLHLYSGEYLLTASNYHYLYCRHCYRIDVHDTADCPEDTKRFTELVKNIVS